MKSWQVMALSASVAMAGCASKPSNFTPADPEMMQEWQVEGSMSIDGKQGDHDTFFTWTQLGEQFVLELRDGSTVGPVVSTLRGSQGSPDVNVVQTSGRGDAAAVTSLVSKSLPLANFGYWLRGMQATEDAKVTESGVRTIEKLEEGAWEVEFDNFMQLGTYQMPDEIVISGNGVEVELNIVRGEPGYLTQTCYTDEQKELSEDELLNVSKKRPAETFRDAPVDASAVLEKLVPASGAAPLPQWVNTNEFCEQLKKLHGGIPDPRVGLYGPDSMMWKISAPGISGAWGAGRALLLQTAHPWVTAGIDDHSIVREDPMLRARRTFINIFTMVYGSMPQVMASANLVHKSHNSITGKIPYEAGAFRRDSEYRANEINAMIWVHATLWDTLVMMYEDHEGPLTPREKDRFYEETKLFAMLFGIPRDALPPDWDSFMAYNRAMWDSPQLTVTPNTIRLKEDLFKARSIWLALPLYAQEIITARVLPPRIRDAYGMEYGLWEKLNYGVFRTSAGVTSFLLPDYFQTNPVYLEAQARLKGERVGYLPRSVITAVMERERLVN